MTRGNDKLLRRRVLTQLADGSMTKQNICKVNKISYGALMRILINNSTEYDKIMENVRKGINTRSLLIADKCVKRIKRDKIEASSGLQLSQISKNLVEITKNDNSQVNIQLNVPQSRDDLISFVLNSKTIDIPVHNESAGKIDDNVKSDDITICNINKTLDNE
jgi:hypothetical protein